MLTQLRAKYEPGSKPPLLALTRRIDPAQQSALPYFMIGDASAADLDQLRALMKSAG